MIYLTVEKTSKKWYNAIKYLEKKLKVKEIEDEY